MQLYAPSNNAEVKSEWSYTTAPPACLYVMDRENFTLLCEVYCNWNTGLL